VIRSGDGWRDIGDDSDQSWNREVFKLLAQLYQMTVTDVSRVLTPQITIAK